jgi:hypothetical protein
MLLEQHLLPLGLDMHWQQPLLLLLQPRLLQLLLLAPVSVLSLLISLQDSSTEWVMAVGQAVCSPNSIRVLLRPLLLLLLPMSFLVLLPLTSSTSSINGHNAGLSGQQQQQRLLHCWQVTAKAVAAVRITSPVSRHRRIARKRGPAGRRPGKGGTAAAGFLVLLLQLLLLLLLLLLESNNSGKAVGSRRTRGKVGVCMYNDTNQCSSSPACTWLFPPNVPNKQPLPLCAVESGSKRVQVPF